MCPTQERLSGSLRVARERVADQTLANYDFDDFGLTDRRSGWAHEPVPEEQGDRVTTVVFSTFEDGTPAQAQFNVFFWPGTISVSDHYVGDWHRPASV